MQECTFYGVHALGHNAIGGGVMNDIYSSPGDPAFFLHHHFVNRIWRLWQNQNPGARLNAIGGYTTSPCEDHQQTSGCQTTGLNYVLSSLNFYPSVTVSQVMNTLGGFLCYKYDY
jgi:tyrosinase